MDLAREYALRVKELAAQEDLAAQAARHAAELEGQRNLWDQRRQQIEALLAERERLMHLADEKHQASSCPASQCDFNNPNTLLLVQAGKYLNPGEESLPFLETVLRGTWLRLSTNCRIISEQRLSIFSEVQALK